MGSFFLFEDVTADQILLKNLEAAQAEANQANVSLLSQHEPRDKNSHQLDLRNE